MLDISSLMLLAGLALVTLLFWRGQAAREAALAATRKYCRGERVILLDQTVALCGRRLRRQSGGWPELVRTWCFEFTVTGHERYRGRTETVADSVLGIYLEPHRYSESAP